MEKLKNRLMYLNSMKKMKNRQSILIILSKSLLIILFHKRPKDRLIYKINY